MKKKRFFVLVYVLFVAIAAYLFALDSSANVCEKKLIPAVDLLKYAEPYFLFNATVAILFIVKKSYPYIGIVALLLLIFFMIFNPLHAVAYGNFSVNFSDTVGKLYTVGNIYSCCTLAIVSSMFLMIYSIKEKGSFFKTMVVISHKLSI